MTWIPTLSKRSPFTLQKDSFYLTNVVLLDSKRTTFATQKDYIFLCVCLFFVILHPKFRFSKV